MTSTFEDYGITVGDDGKVVDYEYDPEPIVEAYYRGCDGGMEAYKFHEALGFFKGFGYIFAKPIDPVPEVVLNDDPDSPCADEYVAVLTFREGDVK